MATDQQPQPPRTQLPVEEREWNHVDWNVSDSGVLALTMNRPERLHALNFPMLHELLELIEDARNKAEIRVITIRGQGTRSFCSGDDLKGMEPAPGDTSATVHHQLLVTIREIPKPVVALICGWALGHGWELANACDMRLCADNIEVGDHRVTRSIGLNGGTSWFVPRIVGLGRALELLMTGRHLKAEEAHAWGWANRVWPLEEFDARASEYVETLAALPTIAAGAFKAAIEFSSAHSLRESLANELVMSSRTRGTEDAEEGRRSFHEKRAPVFKGR